MRADGSWNCRDICQAPKLSCLSTHGSGQMVLNYACAPTCAATPPSNLSVVDGMTVGTTAQVTWTPGTGGRAQYLWVDEDLAEVNGGCPTPGDCEASTALTTSDGSELVSGLLPLTTYHFRVVTYASDTCSNDLIVAYTTPASTATITGRVYLDADNSCSQAGGGMGNVPILIGGNTVTTAANGTYTFTGLVNASYNVSVTMPSGYICTTVATCNPSCTYVGVTPQATNRDFYLTTSRESWWQTEGAGVAAYYASIGLSGCSSFHFVINSSADLPILDLFRIFA